MTMTLKDCLGEMHPVLLVLIGFCMLFCILRLHSVFHQLLYPYFVCRILGKAIDPRSLGHWAVVTGATDGIGLGFARRLAQRGMNLLIVGRNRTKLDNVQKQLRRDFPSIEVKTHAIDLTTQNLNDYTLLGEVIEKLEVGLLFNNAGMAPGREFFQNIDILGGAQVIQQVVSLNLNAVAQVTRLVLPQMVKRRRGMILNNASITGTFAFPSSALYGATKAAVLHFSDSIRLELPGKGIVVQTLTPMYVATKMTGKKPAFFSPSTDQFTKETMGVLGVIETTTGCFAHQLEVLVLDLLPNWLREKILLSVMKNTMKQRGSKLN